MQTLYTTLLTKCKLEENLSTERFLLKAQLIQNHVQLLVNLTKHPFSKEVERILC